MTKTTYEGIYNFLVISNVWLNARDKDGNDKGNAKTKFGYAIQKMRVRAEKVYGKYLNKVEDLNVEHCAVDDKGVIVKDEHGNYRFTKEGLKKRNAEQRKLLEMEVEIVPYFATDIPSDLTVVEEESFYGFVMREPQEAEEETTQFAIAVN